MVRSLKSQITLEYIMTIFLLVTFLIIMIVYFSAEYGDFNQELRYKRSVDLVNSLKIELETAEVVHDGYTHTLEIPTRLAGKDYDLVIHQGVLSITVEGIETIVFIPDVKGNFSKGVNTIVKENKIIKIT